MWSTRSCCWSSYPLSSSRLGRETRAPGLYDFVWEVSTGSATSGSSGGEWGYTPQRTFSIAISLGSSGIAFRGSRTGLPTWRFGHRCPTSNMRQELPGRVIFGTHFTASCIGSSPPPSCSGREVRRFLHLPYAIAVALSTHAIGASTSSPLARGYFITRLARSYGILTAPVAASLTALPPSRTTARTLERMRLIEMQRPGQYIRVPTEPLQAPQPAYAQPGRRRRRPEPEPEPAAPTEPHQEDLAARVARIEGQLEWIGEVLLQIASAQGQRPRPFPARAHNHEAGPSRPPGSD
ncbi:hypothetical protein L2E82_29985 [Cichorium intybus]|uniref:Uncharacterized protein n=1 Tax=Cichorium intybus TaxID=13427 RepID=A0ACB9CZ89_CICIN|nr:hypothetical protein L2E82_29985 [Cichorium intybus]